MLLLLLLYYYHYFYLFYNGLYIFSPLSIYTQYPIMTSQYWRERERPLGSQYPIMTSQYPIMIKQKQVFRQFRTFIFFNPGNITFT